MNLSSEQRRLIEQVVNVFETGRPQGDYGAISIYHDGPHNIRQITYGRSQTTEYGRLRELVAMYVAAKGILSGDLQPYADAVGTTPLVDDAGFKDLLRRAGREDPVMQQTQDQFFDQAYFQPAIAWADSHGFAEALSGLVIYDSFIHSGGILWIIRGLFPESPPSDGGNERTWITQYVAARDSWLSQHPRSAVRATTYRTQCFKQEIARSNWDLTMVPIMANGVAVS
jgi:chitosanase